MRQRYYNPVSYMDPFGLSPVNGLVSNTNLNTNGIHGVLTAASFLPGLGDICSAIDGFIYALVDKDFGMAVACWADVLKNLWNEEILKLKK